MTLKSLKTHSFARKTQKRTLQLQQQKFQKSFVNDKLMDLNAKNSKIGEKVTNILFYVGYQLEHVLIITTLDIPKRVLITTSL